MVAVKSAFGQLQPDKEGNVFLRDFLKKTNTTIEDLPPTSIRFIAKDTLVHLPSLTTSRDDLVSVPFDYRSPEFVSLYKTVGFRDSNVKDSLKGRMRYWKDEIRVYFSDEVDRSDVKGLQRFALQLAQDVDSLKIRVVKNLSESNYVVYYKDNYDYEPRINKKSDLDFYTYWNGGYLNKTFLRISKTRYFNDAERLQQLKYYFFKSLGYFGTTRELDCGSYFSSCSDVNSYVTKLD